MMFEFEKLSKIFRVHDHDIKEIEIYHIKNKFGYYECYQNGKYYKRITKNGFCYNCGNKIREVQK